MVEGEKRDEGERECDHTEGMEIKEKECESGERERRKNRLKESVRLGIWKAWKGTE